MKFFNKALLAGVFAAGMLSMASCDEAGTDERLKPFERPESPKAVAVMEFSGQRCVNCPTGAAILHRLISDNPGLVVAVAIHPKESGFTEPIGPDPGLICEAADAYFSAFGKPQNFPAAVIDGGSVNNNTQSWSGDILMAMRGEAPANIFLAPKEENGVLKVDYTVQFTNNYNGALNLILLITEDGIKGWQQTTSGLNKNYEFDHILRAGMNGTWGEGLVDKNGKQLNRFTLGNECTGTANVTINPKWVLNNCNVVALLVDSKTHAVRQATELSLGI